MNDAPRTIYRRPSTGNPPTQQTVERDPQAAARGRAAFLAQAERLARAGSVQRGIPLSGHSRRMGRRLAVLLLLVALLIVAVVLTTATISKAHAETEIVCQDCTCGGASPNGCVEYAVTPRAWLPVVER